VHHTVGQRRGIGIASTKPYFVLQLDTGNNQLVVGDRAAAQAEAIEAQAVSFTAGAWPEAAFACEVSVRYRGEPTRAVVTPGSSAERTVSVTFPAGQGPIASPGQAIVFYRGDEVIGGGTIDTVQRAGDLNQTSLAS